MDHRSLSNVGQPSANILCQEWDSKDGGLCGPYCLSYYIGYSVKAAIDNVEVKSHSCIPTKIMWARCGFQIVMYDSTVLALQTHIGKHLLVHRNRHIFPHVENQEH